MHLVNFHFSESSRKQSHFTPNSHARSYELRKYNRLTIVPFKFVLLRPTDCSSPLQIPSLVKATWEWTLFVLLCLASGLCPGFQEGTIHFGWLVAGNLWSPDTLACLTHFIFLRLHKMPQRRTRFSPFRRTYKIALHGQGVTATKL